MSTCTNYAYRKQRTSHNKPSNESPLISPSLAIAWPNLPKGILPSNIVNNDKLPYINIQLETIIQQTHQIM